MHYAHAHRVRDGTVRFVFFGVEGRFGSITRSAKLYSTTRAVLRRLVIKTEEEPDDKAGVISHASNLNLIRRGRFGNLSGRTMTGAKERFPESQGSTQLRGVRSIGSGLIHVQ